MRKRISGTLVVAACAASLSGCSLIHYTGPCFGVGCPAGTPGESSQYKMGEGPKAAPPQAQAQAQPAAQPQPSAQAAAQAQPVAQASAATSAPPKSSNSPASLFSRIKAKF